VEELIQALKAELDLMIPEIPSPPKNLEAGIQRVRPAAKSLPLRPSI
jgi:hypothetical protein